MAPVPVGKKSRPRASRSGTSTASTAKQRAKPDSAVVEWSERDRDDARLQGWGVYECIDEKTLKVFFEIQAEGARFAHDGLARQFVAAQNKAGDDLAIKALRVVFTSKIGPTPRRK